MTIQNMIDTGSSAKMISLGNIEGFTETSSAIFENPASLGLIQDYSLSIFQSQGSGDTQYVNASFAAQTIEGVFGIGFMQASTPVTTEGSLETSRASMIKFSYQDIVTDNVSIGVSYSLFSQGTASQAGNGTNLDIGITTLYEGYHLSLLGRNIIPSKKIIYDSGPNQDISTDWIAAASFNVDAFNVMTQLKLRDGQLLLGCGASTYPEFCPEVEVNAGLKEVWIDNQVAMACSAGASYKISYTTYTIAFEKSSSATLDNTAYFSASMNF